MSEPANQLSRAFLPYPVSTLSPPIIPNDLTSFKSRGISQVERDLQQKLQEIRETYLQTIDQKHLATVRLNVDRQWKIVETGAGIESRQLFGDLEV